MSTLKVVEPEFDEQDLVDRVPYENAKIYKAMRHRMWELARQNKISASTVALVVALHTVCDGDTGEFSRNDLLKVRKITLLPKQTVSWAFRKALSLNLIIPTQDDHFVIAHYEADRTAPDASYFRLTANLVRQLQPMVEHKNPRILLFALELLDRGRVFNADICYGMKTLMKVWKLGSRPSRVFKALELLAGIALYTRTPNQNEDGENLRFYPVKDTDTSYTEQQESYRRLNGQVSSTTKHSLEFHSRGRIRMNWRQLASTTMILIQFAIAKNVPDDLVLRMAGLFGSTVWANDIKLPIRYLRRKGVLEGIYRTALSMIRPAQWSA